MKGKSLLLAFFCLLLFADISDGQEAITEEQELQEMVLQELPTRYDEFGRIQQFYPPGMGVKVLMVGMTKFDPPDTPDWDIYHFYDYYWASYPNRWIGIVVINDSYEKVNAKIQIELCYNDGKILWKKAWTKNIPGKKAMLYFTRTQRPKKIGLYSMRGKIYGAEGFGPYNEVSTNYYIYEIW